MKIDDLISISQKFGSPIYVYDAALIKSQYKKLSDAFSAVENLHIKYAVKALSNINIIKILKKWTRHSVTARSFNWTRSWR